MPKVTEEHREAMRRRLREAALVVFARQGIRATSMADILGEAGMSAGAFYGYFPSKDDFLLDTARRLVGAKVDRIRSMRTADPLPHPAEVIAYLFDDLPAELATSGLLLQLWGEARSVPHLRVAATDAMEEVRGELAAHLRDWLTSRGATPEAAAERARIVSPALLGLAQGHLVHGALRTEEDRQRYLRGVHALLDAL